MTNAKKFKDLITNLFELSKTVDGVKTVYISGDFTKHYILKNYGNVYCYYDNTGDLKADFDFYNSIHGEDVIRLFEGLMEEYNPTENFFGEELTTVEHTGTVGNTSNSTVDNKTSAYDSDNLVNDSQVVGNSGGTTTFNNKDTTTYSRHGNLGVATPSDLLGGEAKLRFNTFVEHYLNRWINGCMVGYGDEENEVTFEPDVDYASKTYVDNKVTELAENVDDALNNLTDIVNEHGSSINALDNSLSGLIEEVDAFEDSVDIEITNINNNLTASDSLVFKFATDGEGNYGYLDGDDTFHPFSSGGGAPFEIVLDNTRTGQATNWQEYNTTSTPMPFSGVVRVYLSFWGYKGDYGIYKNGSRQSASFSQYHNTYQCCTQRYVLNVNEGDTLMFRAWGVGTNSAWWSVVAYLTEE